eukprot:COSAG02_NODE_2688_length_8234_cov_45.754230_1_plen_79_part_10
MGEGLLSLLWTLRSASCVLRSALGLEGSALCGPLCALHLSWALLRKSRGTGRERKAELSGATSERTEEEELLVAVVGRG